MKSSPDVGVSSSVIMAALTLDDNAFQEAYNQLETFGLAIWNADYVVPTQEGRKAILRNFLDPSLIQAQSQTRSIDTGGGLYVEGDVKTDGGDIVGRDKITTFDPALLEELFRRIDASSHTELEKDDLKADVEEIVQEAQKGDTVDKTFLGRRLRNIKRMAPDIFDVVVATLANPVAGLGMAVKKIAEKARVEAQKSDL